MENFSIVDLIMGPIVLMVILITARTTKSAMIGKRPEYKYYTKGLYVKLIGGLSLCLIYSLYYGGGDTVNYFHDSMCMVRLMLSNPSGYFTVFFNKVSFENYFYFNNETGLPIYFRDNLTFMVVRYTSLIAMICAGSFIASTLVFAWISYGGMWRLYQVFILEYPQLRKEMAIAVLFIPSVFFWGSGIMKDTITMSAIGYYTYSFYQIFIRRDKVIGNLLTLVVSTFVIMSIKPYIAFALLPGSLIWIVNKFTLDIKNAVIKSLIGPFLLVIAISGGYFTLVFMSGFLGDYSVDKVLEKAVVSNQDLKADYYAGNTFDIGKFDPTIPSMLSKAPLAIEAAIYRPYLWESRNIVMVLSGLESMFLLFISFRFLIRVRIFGLIKYLGKSHLLVFSLIFALFFGFSVGISTSNFGSMVRYRIPVLPFFIGSIFIIEHLYRKDKGLIEDEDTEQEKITPEKDTNDEDTSKPVLSPA